MSAQITRRSLLTSAAALAALPLVTACTGGAGSSDAATADKVTKVSLVTSGKGEPYSLIAADGTWTGIDADVWEEIKKDTGAPTSTLPPTPTTVTPRT